MKKERPTLCQRCLQFGHQKKGKMRDCRGNFCLYCKEPHKTEDKKICEEYKMESTIQNKIKLDKCDTYTAKETLGYGEKVLCVNSKRSNKKRIKTETKEETNLQTNYWSPQLGGEMSP